MRNESPDLVEDDSNWWIQLIDNPDLGQILVDSKTIILFIFFARRCWREGKVHAHWRLCSEGPAVLEAQIWFFEISTEAGLAGFRGPLTELNGDKSTKTYKGLAALLFSPESDGVLESAGDWTWGDGGWGAFPFRLNLIIVCFCRPRIVEERRGGPKGEFFFFPHSPFICRFGPKGRELVP